VARPALMRMAKHRQYFHEFAPESGHGSDRRRVEMNQMRSELDDVLAVRATV
jgi:hypothetical protein